MKIIQALRDNPELSNREIGRRLKVNYEMVRNWRAKLKVKGTFPENPPLCQDTDFTHDSISATILSSSCS